MSNAYNKHHKIVWESQLGTVAPVVALRTDIIDTVIDVNVTNSGLGTKPLVKFYVRPECVRLWEWLENHTKRLLVVMSANGVGKSVEVFYYAMWRAKEKYQRVLYIHTDELEYDLIFKDRTDSDSYRYCQLSYQEKSPLLLDYMKSLMKAELVDIIVLDGSIQWLVVQLYYNLQKYPDVTCVTCTYDDPLLNIPPETYFKCVDFDRFLMLSWEKEELLTAIEKGALTLEEPNFEEIYYYAGGSPRNMQFTAWRIKDFFTEQMRRCCPGDCPRIIGATRMYDKSLDIVNTLMAFYDGPKSAMVNEHVVKTVTPCLALIQRW